MKSYELQKQIFLYNGINDDFVAAQKKTVSTWSIYWNDGANLSIPRILKIIIHERKLNAKSGLYSLLRKTKHINISLVIFNYLK